MSVDPKEFDMPVASFNPNPMKLGLFTDGLPDMPFEQVLDEAVKMGIQVLEIKEYIWLIHDKKAGADHHFPDCLYQLEFSAA